MEFVGLLLAAVAALLAASLANWLARYQRLRRLELAIPGPPSLPILGSALSLVGRRNVVERLHDLSVEHAGMIRVRVPGHFILVVSDPNDIREVVRGKSTQDKSRFYDFFPTGLPKLNGIKWRDRRRTVQPAFQHGVLDGYQDVFRDEGDALVQRLRHGVEEDIHAAVTRTAASAFVRTLLEWNGDADARPPTSHAWTTRIFLPKTLRRALYFLNVTGREMGVACLIDQFVDTAVERRRKVLGAGDVGPTGGLGSSELRSGGRPNVRRGLIDVLLDERAQLAHEDIRDELVGFSAAGVETASSCMAWTFKVLSVRPDLQESILQEVQGVLGSDKGIGTHHLARLEVTERVIKETLRLFPSVPMPARTASEELVLAGKTIPKHSTIFINVPRAHRDPRYWQDPLRFDPDRFLPERAAGRHPYAYLPFSSGPRRCIGAQYAMALIKTVVASVVLAFCVDPAGDGHDSPAHFPVSFAISSWMTGGTRVVFRPRCAAKNGDQHG